MTRQAALPDDSLPHWRERLEGAAPRSPPRILGTGRDLSRPLLAEALARARTQRSDYRREIVETAYDGQFNGKDTRSPRMTTAPGRGKVPEGI